MEKLLGSVSLSFLLRSVFSGAFFVIAFAIGTQTDGKTFEALAKNFSVAGFACALIAGVTAYGIHRSVLFPWFEWVANADWAKAARKKWWTLISANSIKNLVDIWDRRAEGDREQYRGKQIAEWADYIHQQYVSAWCILFGSIAAEAVENKLLPLDWPLIILSAVFVISASILNWRAHSVREHWPAVKGNNVSGGDIGKETPSAN